MSAPIAKIMAITRAEFAASLTRLDAQAVLDGDGNALLTITGTPVRVHFEALPKRRLGGLLSLPQARVTLVIETGDDGARTAALRAFDIAFQRGGG